MPVEALLTLAPTYSSQWMAALVAALPQIIIDLPIFTLIYGSNSYVLIACVRLTPASHIRDLDLIATQAYPWCGRHIGYAQVIVVA